MSDGRQYVLDANVFIQSKRRFYPFDVCPGYWAALIWQHQAGRIRSIDRVEEEVDRGGDDLSQWVSQLPDTFFASTDEPEVIQRFAEATTWAQAQGQFSPEAKAEFASGVDGWLVAYAKAKGMVVVTLEEFDPNIKRKVPIPNVCRAMGVPCVNIFEMLRELNVRFTWEPPR